MGLTDVIKKEKSFLLEIKTVKRIGISTLVTLTCWEKERVKAYPSLSKSCDRERAVPLVVEGLISFSHWLKAVRMYPRLQLEQV